MKVPEADGRWFPRLTEADLARAQDPPRVHRLSDGRAITYLEVGDPRGRPAFWFHGSPGGRLEGLLIDELGRDRGHRFILPDRPGLGGSSPCFGWSMPSFTRDVLELADHLGFSSFSVLGGSGGGPFVLAAAALAPDRVERAVSLACAGSFEIEALRQTIGLVDRIAAWGAQQRGALELYFAGLSGVSRMPEVVVRALGRLLAPGQDPLVALLLARTLRESLSAGPAGLVEDTRVLHRPWGFSLEAIEVPVIFVNGTSDRFVPLAYGRALAARVSRARLEVAMGDGHFRTIFDLGRLARLLEEVAPP